MNAPAPSGIPHPGRSDPPAGHAAGGDGPVIEVTYFTDPVCHWSWCFEPQWRRLRYEYEGRLACRYVMGGMVADWSSYHDPVNAVHNPSQMAAQWYQARQLTGMPLDDRIWIEDPPSSSYPACLGVKAAERQGAGAGEAYLRRLREAVMLERRNVARGEVLLELADELALDPAPGVGFDAERFRDDLLGPEVRDAFHEDLRAVRYGNVGRFPTLTLRAAEGPALALVGYRPFEVIRSALARLAPEIRPARTAGDVVDFVRTWGRADAAEAAQALGVEPEVARRALERAVAEGILRPISGHPGGFSVAP